MGKGGKDIPSQTEGKARKISLEELSQHRTPTDGTPHPMLLYMI